MSNSTKYFYNRVVNNSVYSMSVYVLLNAASNCIMYVLRFGVLHFDVDNK